MHLIDKIQLSFAIKNKQTLFLRVNMINPDTLFIQNNETYDTEGNSLFTSPVLNSLVNISWDHLPKLLPEDESSLDECLNVAFAIAKAEAERVVSDYEGFEWDLLKQNDPTKYQDNKVFLENYEKRLSSINQSEQYRDQLDTFGKLKLLNYLTLQAQRVLYDYRSFSWSKMKDQSTQLYTDNYLYFSKYLQRTREISLVARKKEYCDMMSTHLSNLQKSMNEQKQLEPFIPPATNNKKSPQCNSNETDSANDQAKNIDQLHEELNSMIGLETVKARVAALVSEIEIRKHREKHGLPINDRSYHMVFAGNAGTGKTVVARIIAKMFFALGLTKKDHFVEATRGDLVGGYIGHTAIQTNEIIDKALGGVLFIDEAYALKGGVNDFGTEAITTLLKRMEDERDNLIVIIAGYEKEMEELLDTNQGLHSRFGRKIRFDDYNDRELLDILKLNFDTNSYTLDKLVSDDFLSTIIGVSSENKAKFSNGRGVRNLFERIIENQEMRICRSSKVNKPLKTELQRVAVEDIAQAL